MIPQCRGCKRRITKKEEPRIQVMGQSHSSHPVSMLPYDNRTTSEVDSGENRRLDIVVPFCMNAQCVEKGLAKDTRHSKVIGSTLR